MRKKCRVSTAVLGDRPWPTFLGHHAVRMQVCVHVRKCLFELLVVAFMCLSLLFVGAIVWCVGCKAGRGPGKSVDKKFTISCIFAQLVQNHANITLGVANRYHVAC